VIGLIAGTILVSTYIIAQAKLRNIITEADTYMNAIESFKLKYNAVPGDMSNATSFWSSAAGNGNGNNLVAWATESYLIWQHLQLAGMINGSYNGTSQEPAAKYGIGTFWRVEINAFTIYTVAAGTQNSLEFMSNSTYIISPVDAYSIDIKIDDGVPSNGWVYTLNTGSTGNACVKRSDTNASVLNTYAGKNTYYALDQGNTLTCSRIYFYLNKFGNIK
jgi:hypothetical protein